MKRVIVRCVVAGALAVGVTGVGFANAELAAEIGVDFWSLPELNGQMETCRKHNEELDQKIQTTMTRMAIKFAILDELYDGSLTLREAAKRFRSINATHPKFTEQIRIHHPNWTDDDCQYWNVIDCVKNSPNRYAKSEQLVTRLTEELQNLKEHGTSSLQD